jgi:carboxyl-terminal processing protease
MARRNLFWLLGIAAVSVFGLAMSWSAPTRERDHDYELVRLVVDVLQEVRQKYVVEVGPDRERKLVEDMVNGGLERLDPHSAYINPQEYKQFDKQSEGKFGGVGIQVGESENRKTLIVISPLPGTPAYEAGVEAGDTIVKIDGKPTSSMRMTDAVDMIQGEPGTKVVLSILREGVKEPIDFELTRALIKVASVLGDRRKADNPTEWEYLLDRDKRIGYIRLTSFTRTAPAELKAAVQELEKDGVRGLVLDLRNNPGGLLKAAVEISDLFLTEGVIVSTRGRNYKEEVYRARAEGTLLTGPGGTVPMAVLINRFSASASEILAAALQDHKRAAVVGERSFGKGSVQNIIMMENDTSALKLTTASYWRPSGKNIHHFPDPKDFEAARIDPDEWGVKPDKGLEVVLKDEERKAYWAYRTNRDVPRSRPKPPEMDKDGQPKPPFVDRVLKKALEYLEKEMSRNPAVPRTRDA